MVEKMQNPTLITALAKSQLKHKHLWTIKAHSEQIKSIALIPSEGLLVSTSFDRKIKIWNCDDAKYVEQLNGNKKNINPIGFKKKGTEEIYNLEMQRIDTKYNRLSKRTLSKQNTEFPDFQVFEALANIG